MVVKMMKWSPWQPTWAFKKFQVKVRPMKLEGLTNSCFINNGGGYDNKNDVVVVLEMNWKGPNKMMALPTALRRSSSSSAKHCRNTVSAETVLRKGLNVVEWTDEFERVCSFSILHKDDSSLSPYDVSFNLLYGQKGEPLNKLTVMGTVSLNIAELALETKEPLTERMLPMALQANGVVATEATLSISVSFVQMRSETAEMVREEGFLFRKMRDLTAGYRSKKSNSKKKAKKTELVEDHASEDNGFSGDTDESTIFDSEGSPDENNHLGSTPPDSSIASTPDSCGGEMSQATESSSLENASKGGFWKKRRLSFISSKKKDDPLIHNSNGAEQPIDSTAKTGEFESEVKLSSLESDSNGEEILVESWEEKDLISRDGHAKLQSEIFFASIDQRSERAAGESACTAVVAVMADWVQSNRDAMPTKSAFDGLIVEGSSEWQNLCKNEAYIGRFPDKHFDLETVLEANLRPLSVIPNKSFVGFFCPETFESLKGAMSFDEIWDEISRNIEGGEPNVYIVSWNDHFFLLKMESDAYYIIDSLGERLSEGCNQAYVLRFSDKTKMYNLVEKTKEMAELDSKREDDGNKNSGTNGEGCDEELVCNGKECCREYFKRFLAAIPLKEMEMEEKKSTVPSVFLHQRLQIEFHFCRNSSSLCSSSDSC